MSDDSEAWKGEPEQPEYGGSMFGSLFSWGRPLTPEEIAQREAEQARRKAEAEMRALTVVAYSPAAKCIKCGGEKSKTRFCGGAAAGYTHYDCFKQTAGREHFHRTCKTCRFVWYEWTRDGEHA